MPSGRRLGLVLVACLAAATPATAALLPPGPDRSGNTGQFNTPCDFSHRLSDDPIVYPGKAGASHSHDFLGNDSTDADTTLASLRAANTRCRRPNDHSGYWIPTLYRDGDAIDPLGSNIYYRTAGRDPSTIEPFPAGLKVIAGNSKATGPQSEKVLSWRCEQMRFTERGGPGATTKRKRALRRALRRHRRGIRRDRRALRLLRRAGTAGPALRRVSRLHRRSLRAHRRALRRERRALRALKRRRTGGVPSCAADMGLVAMIRFPDCWDGSGVDSPDHKSHMAYSSYSRELKRRACPASHRVAVPALTLNVRYPTAGGDQVDLASGPAYTMHADFFNAWDDAALADLVNQCLKADKHCGSH
jgi:uncharacterized protein DUF1996